jgi:hypothetical protein
MYYRYQLSITWRQTWCSLEPSLVSHIWYDIIKCSSWLHGCGNTKCSACPFSFKTFVTCKHSCWLMSVRCGLFFLSIASSSSSFSSDRQCSSFHHLMYYRTGAWCVKPSMYQCRLMWCVKPSMYQCRLIDWFFISSIYMKISQIHQHIKNKVSVIYDSSMFCNSLLKELVELETTTDDGKLFQRWMISGKNENW